MKKKLLVTSLLSLLVAAPVFAATNLSMPFSMQAPSSQWGVQPWEDACEETVTLLVDLYYKGHGQYTLEKTFAENRIMHIVNLENMYLGFNKDTNADQMARIINDFFPWEATVVENPTLQAIKNEVDEKRPVIALFHGVSVNNPHFDGEGPDYHTAVIKGYDDQKQEFITMEPGVGVGLDYRYSYDTLISAMHDFLPGGNTINGRKVVLFTSPTPTFSASYDADGDGLGKSEEFALGTFPWLADSDGDGYLDLVELQWGYSPLVNEHALRNGGIVKSQNSPNIYQLKGNWKHHIVDEYTFNEMRLHWDEVVTVSDTFLNTFEEGAPIEYIVRTLFPF